ncbi:MAG: hypothetical protein IJY08_02340, partial [Clostridia bacterium]|nr:hypothetical protein [Clostridia bacterium]
MNLLQFILTDNTVMALSARGVFEKMWDVFTNRFALGLYVLIILGLIIAVIAIMIAEEGKLASLLDERTKRRTEKLSQNVELHLDGAVGGVAVPADGIGGSGRVGKKEEEQRDEPRFYMLDRTDREYKRLISQDFDNRATLEEICERFRNFSASKLGLYYSIDDIRRFVSGLAVTHIVIMQGMSGTGKTSLAYAWGEFLRNPS